MTHAFWKTYTGRINLFSSSIRTEKRPFLLVFHFLSPAAFWKRITENLFHESKTLEISTFHSPPPQNVSFSGGKFFAFYPVFRLTSFMETWITSPTAFWLESCYCSFVVTLCFHLDMVGYLVCFPLHFFPCGTQVSLQQMF